MGNGRPALTGDKPRSPTSSPCCVGIIFCTDVALSNSPQRYRTHLAADMVVGQRGGDLRPLPAFRRAFVVNSMTLAVYSLFDEADESSTSRQEKGVEVVTSRRGTGDWCRLNWTACLFRDCGESFSAPLSSDPILPFPASPFQNTTIHGYIVACHVLTRIRSEENTRSSDVVWLGHSPVHDLVFPAF
jgi:hypothetical protein